MLQHEPRSRTFSVWHEATGYRHRPSYVSKAVNITNVFRKQTKIPFPIGQIKSLMVNAHFIKRFFDLSGIDPNKTLNAKLVKELFGLAVDAA